MREQGIAANATPRMIRGRNRGKTRDAIYRARQRGASNLVRERVTDIAKQLMLTGSFHDPARAKLLETVAYIRRAGVCADLLEDALMDHESVIFQFITTSARSAGAGYGRSRHPSMFPSSSITTFWIFRNMLVSQSPDPVSSGGRRIPKPPRLDARTRFTPLRLVLSLYPHDPSANCPKSWLTVFARGPF
jgi:hypothetical protein